MRTLLSKVPHLAAYIEGYYKRRPIKRTIRTKDGVLMNLDTADFIQRTVFLTGDWDDAVGAALRKHLKSGMTFVDAGANIGFFSLLAAKLVGPQGKVISFEPNPSVFDALLANVSLNGFTWIAPHRKGLFDQVGTGEIFIPDANCGGATMRPGGQGGVTIPLVRMDDVVNERVDLLKIDIEGAEVAALRGAGDLLSRPDAPTVICEVSEYSLRAMGSSKDELFDIMVGHGYSAHIISSIRRSNLSRERVFFQYDVLFSKD